MNAPNPFKVLRLVALCLGVFVLFFALFDTPNAQADADKVYVDPEMPNASRIESRIESRLQDDDDIKVVVQPEQESQPSPFRADGGTLILVWSKGNVVQVFGNSWVPQAAMDDMLYRTQNVNRNPIDTIMGVVQQIHQYQETHPKPAPPPPSPAPAGPPPPPAPPVNWWPIAGYIVGGSLLAGLVLILLVQKHRRDQYRDTLARNAEIQADWGVDDYGIKSTID